MMVQLSVGIIFVVLAIANIAVAATKSRWSGARNWQVVLVVAYVISMLVYFSMIFG